MTSIVAVGGQPVNKLKPRRFIHFGSKFGDHRSESLRDCFSGLPEVGSEFVYAIEWERRFVLSGVPIIGCIADRNQKIAQASYVVPHGSDLSDDRPRKQIKVAPALINFRRFFYLEIVVRKVLALVNWRECRLGINFPGPVGKQATSKIHLKEQCQFPASKFLAMKSLVQPSLGRGSPIGDASGDDSQAAGHQSLPFFQLVKVRRPPRNNVDRHGHHDGGQYKLNAALPHAGNLPCRLPVVERAAA